jgi:hypothetical protein
MAQAGQTFRVFVSSTFSDLIAEREAKRSRQRVFPSLRELCLQHGARFQAIDVRWGVSEEVTRDQRTMTICLDEIEPCRRDPVKLDDGRDATRYMVMHLDADAGRPDELYRTSCSMVLG